MLAVNHFASQSLKSFCTTLLFFFEILISVCSFRGQFAFAARVEVPVVVQLFNWTFQNIEKEVPLLANLGYTHVHVSPPQLSIDQLEWWGRYQPVDYRVIDGPLGNEFQFQHMISIAHQHGIKIIADVVLNHMANFDYMQYGVPYREDKPEVLEYPSQRFRDRYGLSILFSPEHFHNTGCIDDWTNRWIVLTHRLCVSRDRGLPDLNLSHPYVLQIHRDYLSKLKSLGVDGFRIDAVKHMEESYFNKLFAGIVTSEMLVFGESIATQSNFKTDLEPYLRLTSMRFYDFPLLQRMNEAFEGGDLRSLIHPIEEEAALADDRAVTFVVNHDIPTNGSTFINFLMDPLQEMLAFAYIMGRYEGIPYVFSDTGEYSPRHAFFHRRPEIAAMINFRKIVEKSAQNWIYGDTKHLAWTRGKNAIVILNNSNRKFEFSGLQVDLFNGDYFDLISAFKNNGQSQNWIRVFNGQIVNGELPAFTPGLYIKK